MVNLRKIEVLYEYMKKLVLFLFFCGFLGEVNAQSMSDTQVLRYVMQQKKLGKDESEIAQELLKKGVTLVQIQKLRQRYAQQLEQTSMGQTTDKTIDDASRMRKNNGALREVEDDDNARQQRQQQKMQNRPDNWLYADDMSMLQSPDSIYFERPQENVKKVFGRDIFNNKSLTFEPVQEGLWS